MLVCTESHIFEASNLKVYGSYSEDEGIKSVYGISLKDSFGNCFVFKATIQEAKTVIENVKAGTPIILSDKDLIQGNNVEAELRLMGVTTVPLDKLAEC